jgi:hypothetical protein
MNRVLAVFGLLVALSFVVPAAALAQFNIGSLTPLSLEVSPQFPGAYGSVTVTPDSTQFDLAAASLVWYLNGTQVATGTGGQSYTFSMHGPGNIMTVRLVATVGGKAFEATARLVPAEVSLIVEPISTVPPFYEGSPLLASEGRARVVALPDFRTSSGARLDPTKLIYTWKLGDQLLEPQSGAGKSTLLISQGPLEFRDSQVTVTVASVDGSYAGQRAVTLAPVDPVVRLYRDDPLLGPLFNTALGDGYTLRGEEDSFFAAPYFFSTPPAFSWNVGGADAGSNQVVTLRATGSGSGASGVSVIAKGDTFENAQASTVVSFSGNQKQANPFGL